MTLKKVCLWCRLLFILLRPFPSSQSSSISFSPYSWLIKFFFLVNAGFFTFVTPSLSSSITISPFFLFVFVSFYLSLFFSLALFDTLTHPFLTNICLSFFLKVRGCLSFHLFLDIIPLPMFSLTLFVCVCVFVLVHSFSFRSHRTVV